jgi:hypothetical protein
MNYPCINKALSIIKGHNLFYIFVQKNIFDINYRSGFGSFLDSKEVSMKFGGLN